jgi:hypothetical protein
MNISWEKAREADAIVGGAWQELLESKELLAGDFVYIRRVLSVLPEKRAIHYSNSSTSLVSQLQLF